MKNNGESALAERLHKYTFHWGYTLPETEGHRALHEKNAAAILGEHGLFIADASQHEPYASRGEGAASILGCSCGWIDRTHERESYFDHIVGAP